MRYFKMLEFSTNMFSSCNAQPNSDNETDGANIFEGDSNVGVEYSYTYRIASAKWHSDAINKVR